VQNILPGGGWGAQAMIRTISLCALAAFAAAQPVLATADSAPITVQGQALSKWKEAESDHFKIYSDGDEKYLTRLSGRLEAVHYLLKIATGMKQPADENIVKVKVYAVGDIADVQRLIGDRNSNAAGYYDAQLAGPLSVIPRNSGSDGSFSGELILFHEYAHHFMLQYQANAYPSWYVEGFAELAGTASFERAGAITFGKAAKHREDELRYGRRYPAAKMVNGEYLDLKNGDYGWSYGDAWALTHYLTFSDKRRGQLGAYLNAINAGMPFAEAAKVFGDLNGLSRDLNVYVDGGSFVYKSPPLPPEVVKAPVIRPLTVTEAEFLEDKIVMERLAKISTQEEYDAWAKLRAEKKDPVKKDYATYLKEESTARDKWMATLRTKVARFANDPSAHVVIAHAQCMAKDYAECLTSADRALALQPQNWEAMLRKGQALLGLAGKAPDDGKKAAFKDARSWLLKANAANPPAHEPLYYFHQSFADEGRRATEAAVAGLAQVVDTVPQIDGPRLTLASELMSRGRFAEARKRLRPLAYAPHESVEKRQAVAMLKQIAEAEAKIASASAPATDGEGTD
jgi:tetratricopeptide (TPR) repeat protein